MNEPPSETPRNSDMFPVGKTAVDNALKEIEAEPQTAMLHELGIINSSVGLNHLTRNLRSSIDGKEFDQGAAYIHLMLRKNAEDVGGTLPSVSIDIARTWAHEVVELARETGMAQSKNPQILKTNLFQDEELKRGLNEIAKYKADSRAFFLGATVIGLIIRKAVEEQNLSRKLNF